MEKIEEICKEILKLEFTYKAEEAEHKYEILKQICNFLKGLTE